MSNEKKNLKQVMNEFLELQEPPKLNSKVLKDLEEAIEEYKKTVSEDDIL